MQLLTLTGVILLKTKMGECPPPPICGDYKPLFKDTRACGFEGLTWVDVKRIRRGVSCVLESVLRGAMSCCEFAHRRESR